MATDLEQNTRLQRFIELLAELNHQSVEMLQSGDMQILSQMNDTIEEMFSIQHGNEEEVYTAIEEDMQIICENFNEIVVELEGKQQENLNEATATVVKKYLHNIFDANVRIIYAYGLAE